MEVWLIILLLIYNYIINNNSVNYLKNAKKLRRSDINCENDFQ